MTPPGTITDLLAALVRAGGAPRLTWYGPDGERVELSGAVTVNWVNKTANLLVEEFDVGPQTVVGLDLPAHWRTLVWALAAWRVGACVEVRPAQADVLVTTDPLPHAGHAALVAVALPALARRFAGTLPGGAVDAGSAVMTYADQLLWAPPTVPTAPALATADAVIAHADLVPTLLATAPPAPQRVLMSHDDTGAFLRTAVGVLLTGGSVVLLDPGVATELAADAARRDRLVAAEQVTLEL
ncbi:TIGR03089 family protein [Cellulomonas sp.]|uniref:TIGR03089 family protein n=1 Tax=Cellulomonas sp. TaxID=40001 RepID=UPI003BAAFA63